MIKYLIAALVLVSSVGAAHAQSYYKSDRGHYYVIPGPVMSRSVPVPGRPGVDPVPVGCHKEFIEGYFVAVCIIPKNGVWPPDKPWPPEWPKPPGIWPPIPPTQPPVEPPVEPPVPPTQPPSTTPDHIHGPPLDLSPPPSVQPVPSTQSRRFNFGGKPTYNPYAYR